MALALTAFLIPLIGGQLANDSQSLEPGFSATVQSIFHGYELATLQHALLAFLIVLAFGAVALKRKVLQVPHAYVTAPMGAFFLLLLGSVFMSNYRWVSTTAVTEWFILGTALIASVSGLGRKTGPISVTVGLSAGSGLAALLGIVEYGQMKAVDPSWRIFGGWNNPNALAGMMVLGMLVSFGLFAFAFRQEGKSVATSRLAMLGIACALLCGLALFLTGSKGGALSGLLGVAILIVLLAGWKKAVAIVPILGCLALVALLAFAIQKSSGHAASRLANAGSTQDQSAGFRMQLWKGTIALVKENPIGRGLGTYAYYSAKPGTNTRTELAHSTWLQLAAEAGFLAPLALICALLGWLVLTFRSARSLPRDQNALKAAVVAAVAATCAHGFIESNFYYFGIGLAVFLLVGVGIQLSADAGAPEFVVLPVRLTSVAVAGLCLAQIVFAGCVAKLQSNVRWQASNRATADAMETESTLQSIAPFDGETWYRSGFLASSPTEQLQDFTRAAEVAPQAKYYRRLAASQTSAGKLQEAEESLRRALDLDPNNFFALRQLIDIQDTLGRPEDARTTAQKLVDLERSPYFQIRAIPEQIPTETFEARIYLAKAAKDKSLLLRSAVEGFLRFTRETLPYDREMEKSGGAPGMGAEEAVQKVRIGLDAATQLGDVYRSNGDTLGEAWAAKAMSEFQSALDSGQPPAPDN